MTPIEQEVEDTVVEVQEEMLEDTAAPMDAHMEAREEATGTEIEDSLELTPLANDDERVVPVVKPLNPPRNPPYSLAKIRFWEARQGASLKETLATWTAKANTNLVWNASGDYMIRSNILINDTFQNALKALFSKVLEDPNGPSMKLISEAGTNQPSTLIIEDLI